MFLQTSKISIEMTITDSHSKHLLAQLNVTFADALSTAFIISSHTDY